jgi:hypothetical protein
MKCYVCGKTSATGTNLFRQNAKGLTGIWACAPHSKPVEDDIVRIVANISNSHKEKNSPN